MEAKTKLILGEVKSYFLITVGIILYCFSWTGLLAPADVMGGGASGIGLLVYNATGGADGGIPIGTTFLVFNVILLIIGIMTIGFKFGAKTIYAIFAVSLFLRLGQAYLPPDIFGIAGDKLLTSILGGAVCGLGITLCFTNGGSTGGTDIVALILNKFFRVSIGRVLVFCDMIIVGSAYFIFKNVEAIIYGYITMGVLGYTIDLLMSGRKQTVQLMIMTSKYSEMADALTAATPRGVTLLKSVGWYSKSEGYVLMMYCLRTEVAVMHHIIKSVDANAFVTNSSVSGVYGKGFEELIVKKVKSTQLKPSEGLEK